MTSTTVTVEPAPIAPVVPEPTPIDPIRIKVYHEAYVPQFAMCLLPGKHTKDLAGHGVTWRPHKRSLEGTLGVLVVHDPQVLLDSDGDTVTLDRECTDHAALVGGWDTFDPNGDPDKDESGNAKEFARRFGGCVWQHEVTGAAVVWSTKTHDRTEKKTEWRRVTIPFGSDVALFERAWWYHPDSDQWSFSKGGLHEISIALDRKLRILDGPEATRAMVETWTGKTWLGSPMPPAQFEHERALDIIEAHRFRANPNEAGGFIRAGQGISAALVAWPIGGATSAIARALSMQAYDFLPRPYWLREEGMLPMALDGRATVSFNKQNPSIGTSLDSKLGWEFLTIAHLPTNGVDAQHAGSWLLVAAAALFGELWTEVAVKMHTTALALDKNWEMAGTPGNIRWIGNGRARGRTQAEMVSIAFSTTDNGELVAARSAIWKWNRLRSNRREGLAFLRTADAQVLTRTIDRSPWPFYTGYEEALDTMAVFASLPLFAPLSPDWRTALRETILLGRLTASTMRLVDGVWKAGYQVPCNDAGEALPTASYAGPTLQYSSLGGLRAYVAACQIAAAQAPDLLDPIDATWVAVAGQAIAYFDALPFPQPGSPSETLFAYGQGAIGVPVEAFVTAAQVDPVGTL